MRQLTVLMPVYNAEKYLTLAVESILNQTYEDFLFLIINDGSTDRSLEILKKFQKEDDRIKLISRENKGLVETLNEGISLIATKYIARMDADDFSLPYRLKTQYKFMEANPGIGILGSNVLSFEDRKLPKIPSKSKDIKNFLLFKNALNHPTVFGRTKFFKQFKYDEKFNYAEDYHLWSKMRNSVDFYNIETPLLYYRTHESQQSQNLQQLEQTIEISLRNLEGNGLDFNKEFHRYFVGDTQKIPDSCGLNDFFDFIFSISGVIGSKPSFLLRRYFIVKFLSFIKNSSLKQKGFNTFKLLKFIKFILKS